MKLRNKSIVITPEIYGYIVEHGHNLDPLIAELIEETQRTTDRASLQTPPEQATLMGMLARAIGAREAIEVGTFTGLSALCVARALPANGHLLCLDISAEWTAMARRYWDRAGVGHKITLRLGPALDSLRALPPVERFDSAYIDADKGNYRTYYEEVLMRTRTNGLILFDNVLWHGEVANPRIRDPEVLALRDLNDALAADRRVDVVMLPMDDGLTIVRKK